MDWQFCKKWFLQFCSDHLICAMKPLITDNYVKPVGSEKTIYFTSSWAATLKFVTTLTNQKENAYL